MCKYVNFPFMSLRKITMFQCNEKKYEKWWCIYCPVPAITFIAWVIGQLNKDFLFIGLPIGVILTIFLFFN